MIPILDLTEQYKALKPEMDAAVESVMASGHFIMGPQCKAFEAEMAAYVGVRHALGLNSGTDALHLALRALDIGPGDEVITVPFTFVATTEAIGIVGATPVFADVEPDTLCMDPKAFEAAITPSTRAVIPVHLYGFPADMDAIMDIARRRNVAVIEDCAQSVGATVGKPMTGAIGDIGCFSFFPSKNLGAYGDAGMLTTNSDEIAQRVNELRAHGAKVKYYHQRLGINSRLDEIQAAILRVKLPHLERWIERRRAIAADYAAAFAGLPGVATPVEKPGRRHVYHQFTLQIPERDAVKKRLHDAGVQTMVYYPVPLHLQEVHAGMGLREGAFPHSERAARQALSVPIFPELRKAQQGSVIDTVRSAVAAEAVA